MCSISLPRRRLFLLGSFSTLAWFWGSSIVPRSGAGQRCFPASGGAGSLIVRRRPNRRPPSALESGKVSQKPDIFGRAPFGPAARAYEWPPPSVGIEPSPFFEGALRI